MLRLNLFRLKPFLYSGLRGLTTFVLSLLNHTKTRFRFQKDNTAPAGAEIPRRFAHSELQSATDFIVGECVISWERAAGERREISNKFDKK